MLLKLIKFTGILGGVQHCITIFGKCIFDRNAPFVLPLNQEYIDDFCTDKDKPNQALPPAQVTLKKIMAERKGLYQFAPPSVISFIGPFYRTKIGRASCRKDL